MTADPPTSGVRPVTGPDGTMSIDLDHVSPDYAANWSIRLNELAACPVAHTAHHDGFWMVSGYDEITEAAKDWERFSSLHDGIPGDVFAARDKVAYPQQRSPRGGATIPQVDLARFVPSESDGPMHTDIRRLEIPFFTPHAVKAHEATVLAFVDGAIDEVIETGQVDFARDVATVVPTKVTISVIGFDPSDWWPFAQVVRGMNMHGIESPLFPFDDFFATQAKVLELVKERRERPRDDVASALTRGAILGESLSDEEAATILNGLTFAATDTTTSTTLNSLRWLSAHPEERDRLRRSPELIPAAVEEFLRYFSPFFGIARTVARDTDLAGQALAEGERVLLGYAAGNRDPRTFDQPGEVRLDRANAAAHLAFGVGPHRCLGAPLARLEMRLMLARILERMPDFHVLEDGVVEYPTKSPINGIDSLPAQFTAGAKLAGDHHRATA